VKVTEDYLFTLSG